MFRALPLLLLLLPVVGRAEGWSLEHLDGDPDLAAVWSDGAEVWAVGAPRAVHRRAPGGAFTAIPAPIVADLVDVDGAAGDLWVIGQVGILLHWDGKALASLPSASTGNFVAFAAAGKLAGLLNEKRPLTWDGKSINDLFGRQQGDGLRAIAALGGRRFLAVGKAGAAMLLGDVGPNARGVPETTGVTGDLAAVAACASGEAVAVGAVAARRDAKGVWTALPSPPVPVVGVVLDCAKGKVRRVAAVAGEELLVLDVASGAWTRVTVDKGATLTDLHAHGKGLVAVGKAGVVATISSW